MSCGSNGFGYTPHPLLLAISLLFPSLIHLHKAEKLGLGVPVHARSNYTTVAQATDIDTFLSCARRSLLDLTSSKAGGDIWLGILKSGPSMTRTLSLECSPTD